MSAKHLVLLPGMDGTGSLFDPFLSALSPAISASVIRYPPTEPLDYSDLEALVRQDLPTDRPFVLLGESFSGPITASIATNPPPNLEGVIFCCSFVRTPYPFLRCAVPLIARMPVPRIPLALADGLLFGPYSTPKLRALLAEALGRVSSSVWRIRLTSVLSADLSEGFSRSSVPVLYLRGIRDRLVPHSAAQTVMRLRADSKLADIEAPHALLQTVPDEAARIVEAFVSSP